MDGMRKGQLDTQSFKALCAKVGGGDLEAKRTDYSRE